MQESCALMDRDVKDIVNAYGADRPLSAASTIPSSWYLDRRIFDLERRTVFSTWQVAGRVEQVSRPGQYVSCEIAGEPVVVVRGRDGVLRGFFNVCRHHAAAVVTRAEGVADVLRCPYHGWTYSLEGALKGTPDFAGVCAFDSSANGLVPIETDIWERWILVRLDRRGPSLAAFLGEDLTRHVAARTLGGLTWQGRRSYVLDCNWKVFVDNYLDGGYHVPHVHRDLDSVLDYSEYTIETWPRSCLQSSPLVTDSADARTRAVRHGDRAYYYWIHPNFMINCYGDAADTNLVVPVAVDRTEVVFDFFFSDVSEDARDRIAASIAVSDQIQAEDVAVCASVQRGLASRSYESGRLSVRREAGEHLFHRLLHADLESGVS
jgi:phenylpropionate dioxygenase-like ring-hydroxylating dioxygenase large terminal subunit